MSAAFDIIGKSLIVLGLVIIIFGVYAILRLDGFYIRMVITSKVEAMGFVTVTLGAMVLSGWSMMTVKLFIILLFELLSVSASAHAIARSAWQSGFRLPAVEGGESNPDPDAMEPDD